MGNTCLDRDQYLLLGAVGVYLCFEAITTTAPGAQDRSSQDRR